MPSYKILLPQELESLEELPDAVEEMLDLEALIDSRVEQKGDCLLWTGKVNQGGFPIVHNIDSNILSLSPRRLQYIRHAGPIAAGLVVIATCEDKRCLNPDHLFVGKRRQWTERVRKERERNYAKGRGEEDATAQSTRGAAGPAAPPDRDGPTSPRG